MRQKTHYTIEGIYRQIANIEQMKQFLEQFSKHRSKYMYINGIVQFKMKNIKFKAVTSSFAERYAIYSDGIEGSIIEIFSLNRQVFMSTQLDKDIALKIIEESLKAIEGSMEVDEEDAKLERLENLLR